MTDGTQNVCLQTEELMPSKDACDEPKQASSDQAGVDAKPVAPLEILRDDKGAIVMKPWEFKEGDVVLCSIKRAGMDKETLPSYGALVVKVHDKTADGRPGPTLTVYQEGRHSWGKRAAARDFEGELAIQDHLHFHCKPYVHVEPMHLIGDVVLIKGTALKVKITGLTQGTDELGRRRGKYKVKAKNGAALDVKGLEALVGRELYETDTPLGPRSSDVVGPFFASDFTRCPLSSRAPPSDGAWTRDIYALLKEVLTGAAPSPVPPLPVSVVPGDKRPGGPAESSRDKKARKSPSPPPFTPEEEEAALASSAVAASPVLPGIAEMTEGSMRGRSRSPVNEKCCCGCNVARSAP